MSASIAGTCDYRKRHSVAEMTPELANHVIIPEHALDALIAAALADVASEIGEQRPPTSLPLPRPPTRVAVSAYHRGVLHRLRWWRGRQGN